MTDLARGAPEGETPVNPYSLLEAVNHSSDTAHTGWLIFLAIMAYPMAYSLWLSLHRYDLLTPQTYVGLRNYRRICGLCCCPVSSRSCSASARPRNCLVAGSSPSRRTPTVSPRLKSVEQPNEQPRHSSPVDACIRQWTGRARDP